MPGHITLPAALGTLLMTSLLLVSCGESGEGIDQAEVERQATTALAASLGGDAPEVECPGGIAAEAGAEITCTVQAGNEVYSAIVTITQLNPDGAADFDVQLAAP